MASAVRLTFAVEAERVGYLLYFPQGPTVDYYRSVLSANVI